MCFYWRESIHNFFLIIFPKFRNPVLTPTHPNRYFVGGEVRNDLNILDMLISKIHVIVTARVFMVALECKLKLVFYRIGNYLTPTDFTLTLLLVVQSIIKYKKILGVYYIIIYYLHIN